LAQVTGAAYGNFWTQEIYDRGGILSSPKSVAETFVHELLHTANLSHPFEYTQSPDVELVKVDKQAYESTESTQFGIGMNIMNYQFLTYNGFRGDSPFSPYNILNPEGNLNLTEGQVGTMLQSISDQENGAGANGILDAYWIENMGEPVKEKQN